MSLQAFDTNNGFLGSRTVTLRPELQLLGFHSARIKRVVISTAAEVFVVDSFNIHFMRVTFLPLVLKN